MITALERAWRPVVSKLRPSRQVSWHELQDDHTVKWQSPEDRKSQKNITDRHKSISNTYFFQILEAGLYYLAKRISENFVLAPLLALGTFQRDQKQLLRLIMYRIHKNKLLRQPSRNSEVIDQPEKYNTSYTSEPKYNSNTQYVKCVL